MSAIATTKPNSQCSLRYRATPHLKTKEGKWPRRPQGSMSLDVDTVYDYDTVKVFCLAN